MNYSQIRVLNNKLYFNITNVAELLNIKRESAIVLCNRYVKQGLLIRLKRDFYILKEKWDNLAINDYMEIANYLQVPSYISFMSALIYYELSTQIQRNFIESACERRSIIYNCNDVTFNYYKFSKKYYYAFKKVNNIFIAEKEKAFIDSVYLNSFGKYSFDVSSLDLDKFDKNKIENYLAIYPDQTKRRVEKYAGID